jgi:hypothetical protein
MPWGIYFDRRPGGRPPARRFWLSRPGKSRPIWGGPEHARMFATKEEAQAALASEFNKRYENPAERRFVGRLPKGK